MQDMEMERYRRLRGWLTVGNSPLWLETLRPLLEDERDTLIQQAIYDAPDADLPMLRTRIAQLDQIIKMPEAMAEGERQRLMNAQAAGKEGEEENVGLSGRIRDWYRRRAERAAAGDAAERYD